MTNFLRLNKSNCKNCYKCIRYCPVKSIRFSGNQAHIMPDECIYCGRCYVVCHQHAREIVSEKESVRHMIVDGDRLVASLASSFVAKFPGVGIEGLRKGLREIGFIDAEEAAIGATIVAKEYERLLKEGERNIIISSQCHSVNLMVQKYFPDLIPCLAPVMSPMLAHSLDIKRRMSGVKTVFIGSCLAKKDEMERYPGIVDAVLTYDEINGWFKENGVKLEKLEKKIEKSKARIFPISGGVIECIDKSVAPDYKFIAIDGAKDCYTALKDIREVPPKRKFFIELATCDGSCIRGPVVTRHVYSAPVNDRLVVTESAGSEHFDVKPLPGADIAKEFEDLSVRKPKPSAEQLKKILKQMGRSSGKDMLNCGTCGYDTCMEKATAVYEGKAEIGMCLPYLMERAEKVSGNIMNATSVGIMVLNENLEVQQINREIERIMRLRGADYLVGEPIVKVMDPHIFMEARDGGKSVKDRKVFLPDYGRTVLMNVNWDPEYRVLVCVMNDITEAEEAHRRKEKISHETVETADRVVARQMRIVQDIASLLGETAAETKVALTRLKESIENE